uniref:phenylalanine--tRNA ligase n=1 Tax=Protohalopteris sp. TaxID=2843287 RepID=A0A8F0F795_9PHAE|nr:phenylalanyl-tRNA synthetase [Protohalopteris sp.]
MHLSLKWIEALLGLQELPLNDLLDRLTLAGFEIENVSNKKILKKKYLLLEINITANRFDVANIKGLLFEIFSLFDANLLFQIPTHIKPLFLLNSPKENFKTLNFFYNSELNYKLPIKINKFNLSNHYNFFLFKYSLWENYLQKKYFYKILQNFKTSNNFNSKNYLPLVNIKSQKFKLTQSPYWIKKRLLINNFNPKNNILDTLHYLMLETGQVFFAYDFQGLKKLTKTSSLTFISKYANNTDLLHISKNKTINLNNTILTFRINETIVSIAGLIQHFNTLVTNQTSKIVIQGGLYNSNQIKQSSKNLSIRTEYSLKLEKRADLNSFEQAYLRLLYLFWVQGIKFENILPQDSLIILSYKDDFLWDYIKFSQKKLKIVYKNINNLIGPYKEFKKLSNLNIIRNLKILNFKITYKTDQNCYLLVPLARHFDIEREVDVIEEIVRSLGFSKFSPILPTMNQFGSTTKLEKFKRRLKTYFLNFGFNESLHSIFAKKNIIYQTKLENPLLNNSSVLRISLINTLIKKIKLNNKKDVKMFEAFEFGRVYKLLSNYNKEEVEIISGVFGGKVLRSSWQNKSSTLNWFEAKGLLEDIFAKLNLPVNWIQANFNSPTNFHPRRTANIFIGEQILGTFGQIHPNLVLTETLNKKIYLFELNLEILNKFWQHKSSIYYIPYSSYPISYIDLSCIVNKNLFFNDITQKIYTLGQPLLQSIVLFDYYSKAPIKEGYCSLSFKLQFKSNSRTLINSEINEITHFIIKILEKNFDIKFQ